MSLEYIDSSSSERQNQINNLPASSTEQQRTDELLVIIHGGDVRGTWVHGAMRWMMMKDDDMMKLRRKGRERSGSW